MRCSFTLSRTDFIALHRVVDRRLSQLSGANTKLFFSNLFIWVPLGIAFAAYAAMYRKYPEMTYDLSVVVIAFCIGVVLMIAGAIYKQRIYRKTMLSPASWFLSEQTVALDPDGLSAEGTYGKAHYPWPSFLCHLEDENNLYLFIDNAQAFVLPKAALGASEHLAQVKEWVSS